MHTIAAHIRITRALGVVWCGVAIVDILFLPTAARTPFRWHTKGCMHHRQSAPMSLYGPEQTSCCFLLDHTPN